MRQCDHVHARPVADDDSRDTDLLEPAASLVKKRSNRDASHGHDQRRPEQLDLALEPGTAVAHLLGARDAIAAFRVLAREAATHRCDVHARAKLRLIETERQKPLEQLLTGGPRERAAQRRLFVARCLPARATPSSAGPCLRLEGDTCSSSACRRAALVDGPRSTAGFDSLSLRSALCVSSVLALIARTQYSLRIVAESAPWRRVK